MNDNRQYMDARKQARDERGFYSHLFVFICVNIFFFVLNLIQGLDHLWFFWPTLGWGIGVFFHWLGVFGKGRFLGKDWEKKRIQEIIDKENRNV